MAPDIPTDRDLPAPISDAEDRLRESEARFRALFESSRDAIAVSAGGRHVFVNAAYAAMYGFARADDLVGAPVMDRIAPSSREMMRRRIERRAQGLAEPDAYEVRGLRSDGAEFDLENRVTRYEWQGGTYTLVIQRDVSAQKRAAEALQEGERRLRLALDAGGLGTWHLDVVTGAVDWPPGTKALFGLPPDAPVERGRVLGLIHPEDSGRIDAAMRTAMSGGPDYNEEYRVVWPDGTLHWLASRGRVHRDARGAAVSMEGVIQNIDDRRKAEEVLAAALRREVMLNQIGQAIRGTRDPDTIQATAVQALGAALGVDRAYFTTLDLARDASWVGRDFRRSDLPTLAGHYRVSDYRVDPAAFYPEGKTLVLPDVRVGNWPEPLAEAVRSMRVRASVSVPLFDKDSLVGTLAVAMADEPRAWTGDEIALVESVAGLTRAALDTARVQEQERRIAEHLQDALQPALPAHVPGLSVGRFTRPALDEAAVGGDFFDVFPLDQERYALVIGDVSGKGLAAAQQLALVRNSLRTTLYLYGRPAEAAGRLNAIVTAHDLLVGFVTVFVGVYDAVTGRVAFCSCGHEPGLVRRASGGAVERLVPTGPPLGVDEGAAYGEASVTLAAGDTLLLYTDGLSEAGPDRRDLLGTDGLARLLGALPPGVDVQPQAEALVAQVRAGAGGPFRDDVAVLLARRG